jgi:hypothetical protein
VAEVQGQLANPPFEASVRGLMKDSTGSEELERAVVKYRLYRSTNCYFYL